MHKANMDISALESLMLYPKNYAHPMFHLITFGYEEMWAY
jgi:hypothetical protein